MYYTIKQLADIAGISARTIRFYDEIDLLKPEKVNLTGYRQYGKEQVETLQQILFFKELGLNLSEISKIIKDPCFDRVAALRNHLHELTKRAKQIDKLIGNVKKTILTEDGKEIMKDKERFEGFKKNLIRENEELYGKEIRKKHGDDTVDTSNAKMIGLSQSDYNAMQTISAEILSSLENAVNSRHRPDSSEGKRIALLHKDWLSYSWTFYSKEAHIGLGQMYVDDERFTKFYDSNVKGCAQFLCDVIKANI